MKKPLKTNRRKSKPKITNKSSNFQSSNYRGVQHWRVKACDQVNSKCTLSQKLQINTKDFCCIESRNIILFHD
jgi:hypothetical protein